MNIRAASVSIVVLLLAIVIIAVAFTYTVVEGEVALKVSASNEVVQVNDAPGLHFALPLTERILKLDKRVVFHDYPEERYVTADGQVLRVDCFIAWQIVDASAFYKSTQGNVDVLQQGLGTSAHNALKDMMAKRSLKQAVAADRNESITELYNAVTTASAQYGVKLIDVRIHKIGLLESYNDAVYTGMRNSFRKGTATERAQGDADAREIRAQADRARVEMLAIANRDAAMIRGEGDAQAAAIYANAYRANAEFFSFYRSLQAYRESIGKPGDVLVISPDSDFFKYFNKPASR